MLLLTTSFVPPLLLTGKTVDVTAAGFNKFYCNLCKRATWHYTTVNYKTGAPNTHCTEHSAWPNAIALARLKRLEQELYCELCNVETTQQFVRAFGEHKQLCPSCFTEQTTKAVHPNDMGATPAELELRRINDEGHLTKRELFFVEEKQALDAIQGTTVEKYNAVRARIEGWANTVFEANSKRETAYTRLQEIARTLTSEEKTKLKIVHTEYNPGALNPSNVKPVVKKERVAKADKTKNKFAQIIFGAKITKGNMLSQQLYKEHPEYFSNGIVKPEHKDTVDDYILLHDGMTMEQAIDAVQQKVTGTKAKVFSDIASGKAHLDGTPIKPVDDSTKEGN